LTTYRLVFEERARKDWDRLDRPIRERFKKKLRERLDNPKVPSARLRDLPNCYKIKLGSPGFRLVYQVHDDQLIVLVIAIGKREREKAYAKAAAALARLYDRS
jgi:mRNA interferase RelE/StbE